MSYILLGRWRFYFLCLLVAVGNVSVSTVHSATLAPPPLPALFNLDIDGDGTAKFTSDGILILRYLFGFRGALLTASAVADNAARYAEGIESYLANNLALLDIDKDGKTAPLSDGLMMIRYLAGFRGEGLLNGAVNADGERTEVVAIESYLRALSSVSFSHARVDNPFADSNFYLNPDYQKKVEDSRNAETSELAAAMAVVQQQPTAIWFDRIASIEGDDLHLGLRDHLDAALAQLSSSFNRAMTLVLVVYNLPNRDCAAFASNGELRLENDGLNRYKTEYIDALYAALSANPDYQKLRVVAVIEPDSLPNIVTNLNVYPDCRIAEPGYREGVTYAISKLSTLENVYLYLDIAHSGWLGRDNTQPAVALYREILNAAGGADKIRGFASNVANYSTLLEPFNPYDDVNANQDLIANFYGFNRVIDEAKFIHRLQAAFPDHGYIIDTSRNGWPSRAARQPRDARTQRGNWCNISGAGIGERPQANPETGIDAYFWVKPPGESDGTSDVTATTSNEEGKRFDKICGQLPVVHPYAPDTAVPTDALPNAPHSGHWFPAQFRELVENANPPLI